MTPDLYRRIDPDHFIAQLFRSKSVQRGAVIRRSVRDVERILGRDAFRAELRRRGFRAAENGGQFVIFCNAEPIRIVD